MNVDNTAREEDVNVVITRITPRNQTYIQTGANVFEATADYAKAELEDDRLSYRNENVSYSRRVG